MEDLYQYDLNLKPFQYKYKGKWRDFKVIKETIPVKDEESKEVLLYYSHHGPVTYLNKKALKAFSVRCAWLEPGGSPYLASLRMDQAKIGMNLEMLVLIVTSLEKTWFGLIKRVISVGRR